MTGLQAGNNFLSLVKVTRKQDEFILSVTTKKQRFEVTCMYDVGRPNRHSIE
jgi:hypothetical protein